MQLIERPKTNSTTNKVIKSIMETTPKVSTLQNSVGAMTSAIDQLIAIGITKYLKPVIRLGYPHANDTLYLTLDPEKVLVVNVVDKLDIDLEFDDEMLTLAESWYDSAIFDLYIPKSELYSIGKLYNIRTGADAWEITIGNGPVFAYYLVNKGSLIVGNWLHDKDYIDVIVRKVWPILVEKLYLKDRLEATDGDVYM